MLEKKQTEFFQSEKILNTFLKAVNDVNPNICRLIIDILPLISNKEYFLNNLYNSTLSSIEEADALNVRSRTHLYTKKIFNLYWSLEAISVINNKNNPILETIIQKTFNSEEYTIREKSAKIICSVLNKNDKLNNALLQLANDENFYVRLQAEQM